MALVTAFLKAVCNNLHEYFIFLSLITLILYVLKIQKYKQNWEKYPEFRPTIGGAITGISVIIAFRNEVANLETLLSALKKQAYPAELYEIILVNDHSNDGSDAFVRRFCEDNPNFILIHNKEGESGKKAAIMNGERSASHELIVTTDADCVMGIHWLATIAQFYCENNPDMIIGLVDIVSGSNFIEKFKDVEYLSLIAAGAGAAAGQEPIYCNAACFAFKKSLYQSLDDPLQMGTSSGDDTLFMQNAKDLGKGIMLLKSVAATVVTTGISSWKDYMNQRMRWISKSRRYRDADIIYIALLVFLVNLLLIVAMTLFAALKNFWLFPVMYAVKTFSDLLFLKSFLLFYKKELPTIRFMVYALIYQFYAVFFAIAGLFSGFTWKGRRFKVSG